MGRYYRDEVGSAGVSAIQGKLDDGFHARFEVEGEAGRDGDLDDHGVVIDIGVFGVCSRLGAGIALCGGAALSCTALSVSTLRIAVAICLVGVGIGSIGAAGIRVVVDAEGLVGGLLGGFIGCGFVGGRFDVLDGTLELVAVNLVGGKLAEAEFLALLGLDFGFDPDIIGITDIRDSLSSCYHSAFGDVRSIVDRTGNRGDDIRLLRILLGVVECSLGLAELEFGVLHGFGIRWLCRRLIRHGR